MIGVILNPKAGRVARSPRLAERLREIVGNDGRVYETRDAQALHAAMLELRQRRAGVVGICGGDGTALWVMSEVAALFEPQQLPQVLFLPAGTVNTIAADMGVRGRAEDVLARYVERVRLGETVERVERDLLRVGERCGFLFGAGMGGRFFESYYGGPVPGIAWATVLAVRIFGSALVGGKFAGHLFAPVRAEVTVDGVRLPHDSFTLIVAGAVRNAGLGFKPTYRAGSVPGTFHLFASGLPPNVLARNARRVLRGEPLRGKPHFDLLAHEVQIRFAAEEPCVVDGDLFHETAVTLRAGPRVTFLVPGGAP